jgi:membrane peptidoglycan carboxypeptidase
VLVGVPLLLGAVLVIGLNATPSVTDMEHRAAAVMREHHVTPVPLRAIPDRMSEALIAIEDERFYQHHGVDTQGLVRALFADLYHGKPVQGASTLTEQLVKRLYLQGSDDGWHKLEDVFLAIKLETVFSKHQILAAYLNTVYFGHGAWGIGQAAGTYFHVPSSSLDLARASMLAGLPQSPSYYDPYVNACGARARQFAVLAQMVHDGYISQGTAARAYSEPIGFPCK